MEQMNEKLMRLYTYIVERISAGRSPSLREMCQDLGIKSTSTVHKYLSELEEMGYIERDPNLNRSICLPSASSVQVPLLGTVAAGSPILAVER
jgi:repressor LexA